MAMMKSIGRTLAQIDVAANTSVRIHEDFFNSHRISQHLSREHGSTRVKDHIEVCDDTPVTPPIGK
jgi:hypothetical protein